MVDKLNQMSDSEIVARLAAKALEDKKGIDVVVLDLRDIYSAPAPFFVIASGNVPSHVSALSDHVFEVIKKATGYNPHKIEGYNNAEWILMDYFDVVVHIFQTEKREFFRLEQLWEDGTVIKTEN